MLADLPPAAAQGLGRIEKAIAAGDLEGMRRAAHALKGGAGSYGAARLAAAAKEFELAMLTIDAAIASIGALQEVVAETLAAFRRLGQGAAEA